MSHDFEKGLWAATGACLIWGVFPIFWKWLDHVPALQLMTQRLAWCFVFVVGYLTVSRGVRWWRPFISRPRLIALLSASGTLIALNWWLYIWAVNAGHVVETSLGYFINPLANVLLGVAVLKERLNGRQWLAVLIAASGVLYMGVQTGVPPWIALALACSFSLYGLIRKVAVVDSIPALGLENALLIVPVLAYLFWVERTGSGAFGHQGLVTDGLLVASGLVTAVPLVLFVYGAQRIPYSMMGILQYIAPTLQLGCGLILFREPFSVAQGVGFGAIWVALALYAADGFLRRQRDRRQVTEGLS
jgi:chloramphenicol-sensitive protein RarD